MRAAVLASGLAALTVPALAEVQAETHVVGDRLVQIAVTGNLETLTVGPSAQGQSAQGQSAQEQSAQEQSEVLSGADVEIVLFAGDPDSVALLGEPVLLVEVTGTHSCETGDARAYWAVTLGDRPMSEGPVTTCQALTPGLAPAMAVLEADPMAEGGEFWAWTPGKGWSGQAE